MRISGNPPQIVGKKLDGELGTAAHQQAELTKYEIQRFLRSLGEASDQAQVDIADLLAGRSGQGQKQPHIFLLMGA